MKTYYKDILSRIQQEPKWFDENGVPRYDDFQPWMVAEFYASSACLVLIRCQTCAKEFKVAFSQDKIDLMLHPTDVSLIDRAKSGSLHYGDPPNIGCCDAGPTENSLPIKCLEFWRKDSKRDWVRVPEAEVEQEW